MRQAVIRVLLPNVICSHNHVPALPCHAGILNSSNIMTVIALATKEGSITMIRKSLMASLCKGKGLAQRPLTK